MDRKAEKGELKFKLSEKEQEEVKKSYKICKI